MELKRLEAELLRMTGKTCLSLAMVAFVEKFNQRMAVAVDDLQKAIMAQFSPAKTVAPNEAIDEQFRNMKGYLRLNEAGKIEIRTCLPDSTQLEAEDFDWPEIIGEW